MPKLSSNLVNFALLKRSLCEDFKDMDVKAKISLNFLRCVFFQCHISNIHFDQSSKYQLQFRYPLNARKNILTVAVSELKEENGPSTALGSMISIKIQESAIQFSESRLTVQSCRRSLSCHCIRRLESPLLAQIAQISIKTNLLDFHIMGFKS